MENNYKDYLESYAWKALKKMKLEEQPNCECCGVPATSVHHLSYERRGSERESDIVSICERCHHECHFVNGYQIKNDEEILRRRFEEVRTEFGNNTGISHKWCEVDMMIWDAPSDSEYEILYAKDYNNVFIFWMCNEGSDSPDKWFKIDGADPETFRFLDDDRKYAKDKNFVYYFSHSIQTHTCYIHDPEMSETTEEEEERSDSYESKKIDGADPETFRFLDDDKKYAKDKNYVYYYYFHSKTNHYSEDAHSYSQYSEWKKIDGVDTETFRFLGGDYAKDENFVYLGGKKIDGADPETFRFLGSDRKYANDRNFVYYLGTKIDGAHSLSFKYVDDNFTKDKKNVYWRGKKIDGVDPETLEIVGEYTFLSPDIPNFCYWDIYYIKDRNNVYYRNPFGGWLKINGVDPGTLEFYDTDSHSHIIDKNHVYSGIVKDCGDNGDFLYCYWGRNNKLTVDQFRKWYKEYDEQMRREYEEYIEQMQRELEEE
ncbi:DKNYY domain-containing protein [Candidatus Gracilibacteria bacterium]|nr:DKNYY domain-containing protein [Candidatus Gracilibacteria bacterium]